MKTVLKAALAAGCLLAAVCAAPAFAQAPASAAPPASAAAPVSDQPAAAPAADVAPAAPAAPGDIGPAPADKGQVVFYRPSKLGGAALSFSVHEGAKGVGKLGNGQYFVLLADPGIHSYSNQSEAKDTLRLEIGAGETYYVQQTIGMGLMVGRPHLTPSDEATFKSKKLKLSTKTASDTKE